MYNTVNYLFAAYLQTPDGGNHSIYKVKKIRPGKAEFVFDITEEVLALFELSVYVTDIVCD